MRRPDVASIRPPRPPGEPAAFLPRVPQAGLRRPPLAAARADCPVRRGEL